MGLLSVLMWKEVFDIQNKEIDREVIKEGPANMIIGFENTGGKLFLTKDTLLFYSHGVNLKIKRLIIPIALDEIIRVDKVSTLGFIPNGIKIITKEKDYKLVVQGRKNWINEIEKLIS